MDLKKDNPSFILYRIMEKNMNKSFPKLLFYLIPYNFKRAILVNIYNRI